MHIKVPHSQAKLFHLLKEVARRLHSHQIGAIPTETFYGLACDPFSDKALERLFEIKGRELDKPIPLLLGRLNDLSLVVERIPPLGRRLIKLFWPGPLTIIFPAKSGLPKLLTGETQTVGVRLPGLELTRRVAQFFEGPITGTSANRSQAPPLDDPIEVLKNLPEVDFILDAGKTKGKAPSTVVSVIDNELKLVREGLIPLEEIQRRLKGNL